MQPLSDTLTLLHWLGAVFLSTMIIAFSAVAGRIRDGLRGAFLVFAAAGVMHVLHATIGVPPTWVTLLVFLSLGMPLAWFARRHGLFNREHLARYFSSGSGPDAP